MVLYKVLQICPQMNSRNMIKKKNSQLKIVKVIKSTSKTILNHLLLRIAFDAKY